MNASLFVEYVSKVWPRLQLYVKEKFNSRTNKPTYLHKSMLTKVYSADQKWEGTSANTNYVMADMVAMDSPLPLKSRDSVATASGKLPKIGMKKVLKETDINTINIMIAHLGTIDNANGRRDQLNRIYNRILNDGEACSFGIDERNERNFLEGLSDGVILIEDEENTGTGLRISYGYQASHSFGVETKGECSADDIERVLSKVSADGNSVRYGVIDLNTYRKLRKSRWAKELVASYNNITFSETSVLKVPTPAEFNAAVLDEYGFEFYTIDRTVLAEKNGHPVSMKPFKADRIVFLPSIDNVGSLVWGTPAEFTRRVAGVEYSVVDEYKLISRYSKTDPLIEYTAGQSLVLPVIENVDQIYILRFDEAQVVDTTAENSDSTDVKVTVWGSAYTKSSFVTELNKIAGTNLAATATDAAIVKAVNKLSDADEVALKAKVETYKAS